MVDILVPSSDMDMIDKSLLKKNITKNVLIDDVQLYLENDNDNLALTSLRFGNSEYLILIAIFEKKNNFSPPTRPWRLFIKIN